MPDVINQYGLIFYAIVSNVRTQGEIMKDKQAEMIPREPSSPKPSYTRSRLQGQNFQDSFNLANHAVKFQNDLNAVLICELNDKAHWDIYLTNIHGGHVVSLLGCFFALSEKYPIGRLFPTSFTMQYHENLEQVLNDGPTSPYWPFLFSHMLNRTIKIFNPMTGISHFVEIYIDPYDSLITKAFKYEFKITLSDVSHQEMIATKAGSITHDLRGLIHAGQQIIDELHQESQSLNAENTEEAVGHAISAQQKMMQIKDIFALQINLCKDARDDFLPMGLNREQQTIPIPVFENLDDFFKKLPLNLASSTTTRLHLEFKGQTKALFFPEIINILKQFIFNLIKNAIEADASAIIITILDELNGMMCQIVDNGKGMNDIQMQEFFKRSFPSQKALRSIEEKRGEGTLMCIQKWEAYRGEASVSAREDGLAGTQFQLQMPCHFFKEPAIQGIVIKNMNAHLKTQPASKIILIIDDCLLQLKLVIKKILARSFSSADYFKEMNQNQWKQGGSEIIMHEALMFVCCSNAEMADEITQSMHVDAILTDLEMPGELDGAELIQKIRLNAKLDPISLALHTSTPWDKIIHQYPELSSMDVVYVEKTGDLSPFINAILPSELYDTSASLSFPHI